MARTKKLNQVKRTASSSKRAAAAVSDGTIQPLSRATESHSVKTAPALDTGNAESVATGSHPIPGTDDEEDSQASVAN
jgi:hypothetical protein